MEKRHNSHQASGIFRWILSARNRRQQLSSLAGFDESARSSYYHHFQDSQANLHLAAH